MLLKRVFNKLKRILKSMRSAADFGSTKATSNGSNPKPKKILFIDDCVPYPSLGAGYPRSHQIILHLEKLGHAVTFYPMMINDESLDTIYKDIPRNIEVIAHCSHRELDYFLKVRSNHYAVIIISRPYNMQRFKQAILKGKIDLKKTRIIYDAEALFTPREVLKHQLQGKELTQNEVDTMLQHELTLTNDCDAVLSVSRIEKHVLESHGIKNVHVLKHATTLAPTPHPFNERKDFLFIGPLYPDHYPNTDALLWFINEILPLIKIVYPEVKLTHAGVNKANINDQIDKKTVEFIGKIEDLTNLYNNARVFIAPTRMAAGVPLKVYEAAAHGLPVVCTSLLAKQLEWTDEVEILVADTPAAFANQCIRLYQDAALWDRIRANALKRVSDDCSSEVFKRALETALTTTLSLPPTRKTAFHTESNGFK